MLLKLYATGFKSLINYEIDFNPGLNVLIGPNGSGKTTVCQAVGLLSAIISDNISDYILSIGGAESAFTKCKTDEVLIPRKMEVGCTGIIKSDLDDGKNKLLRYKYTCMLELDETLTIGSENLNVSYKANTGRFRTLFKANRDKKQLSIRILDKKAIGPYNHRLMGSKKTATFAYGLPSTKSFFTIIVGFFYLAFEIKEDIVNFQLLNIDPHLAKEPSDLLESSMVQSNGRGLSNALTALKKNNPQAFEEVNSFLNQICSRYEKIITETDDQKLMRSFVVIDSSGIPCPARSLSDGTIKTIALLTAIHTRKRATIVIEEPENYLHPWACQNLVEYFRSIFKSSVCILTTHSETLLNEIHPSELIVCTNETGVTHGNRLKNSNKINKAISATGFGCGYHYLSGAFGGNP